MNNGFGNVSHDITIRDSRFHIEGFDDDASNAVAMSNRGNLTVEKSTFTLKGLGELFNLQGNPASDGISFSLSG